MCAQGLSAQALGAEVVKLSPHRTMVGNMTSCRDAAGRPAKAVGHHRAQLGTWAQAM